MTVPARSASVGGAVRWETASYRVGAAWAARSRNAACVALPTVGRAGGVGAVAWAALGDGYPYPGGPYPAGPPPGVVAWLGIMAVTSRMNASSCACSSVSPSGTAGAAGVGANVPAMSGEATARSKASRAGSTGVVVVGRPLAGGADDPVGP